jgi:anti-sigma factor RsiW
MRKSDHPIAQEELMAYLDGELSVDRAATAAEHLERCRECQALAAELRGVSEHLMAWQIEPLGPRMDEAVFAGLVKRGQARETTTAPSGWTWRTVLRVRPWVLGLAGACVAVLALVTVSPQRSFQAQRTFKQLQADVTRTREPVAALSASAMPQATERSPRISVDSVTAKRMVVRTAQIALTTTNFDSVRDRIEDILKRHQGYVGQLNVSAPQGAARTLEATLRVSAGELDAVVTELKKLGRVESE